MSKPPEPQTEQPREEPKVYTCPTCGKTYSTAAGAQVCYQSH